MKTALITGIAGQDGSYLAEHLVALGYNVHGLIRMNPKFSYNLRNVIDSVSFHYGDLRDEVSLETTIRRVYPDEIYNLAGQTFVPTSWTHPAMTFDANTSGVNRILKIVESICKKAKVYQASTSEMFGNVLTNINIIDSDTPLALNESSRMHPVSPYGISKLSAHKLMELYRYRGVFAVSGILFNHESPRRGAEMVTMKIAKHVARWMTGDWVPLRLGEPASRRDWGFAGDYVVAMHAMLQKETPSDYVIGTGIAHSVKDFVDAALEAANLYNIPEGVLQFNDPEFVRKGTELHCLVADSRAARKELDWNYNVGFKDLVSMMVNSEYYKLTGVIRD